MTAFSIPSDAQALIDIRAKYRASRSKRLINVFQGDKTFLQVVYQLARHGQQNNEIAQSLGIPLKVFEDHIKGTTRCRPWPELVDMLEAARVMTSVSATNKIHAIMDKKDSKDSDVVRAAQWMQQNLSPRNWSPRADRSLSESEKKLADSLNKGRVRVARDRERVKKRNMRARERERLERQGRSLDETPTEETNATTAISQANG